MKETPKVSSEKQEAKKCAACGDNHPTAECSKLQSFSKLSDMERKSLLTKLSRVEKLEGEDIQSTFNVLDESGRQALIMEISYAHGFKSKPKSPEDYEEFRKRRGNVLVVQDPHDFRKELESRPGAEPIQYDRDWGKWVLKTHSVGISPEVDAWARINPIKDYIAHIKNKKNTTA